LRINLSIKLLHIDAANRLTSVNEGGITTTYTYSGDGDRVSQTVDGVTTTYVIDVAAPLTMVLAEKTGNESVYYLHGLNLIGQSDGVSMEYFTYDGLGSVRQVVDGSGEVIYGQGFRSGRIPKKTFRNFVREPLLQRGRRKAKLGLHRRADRPERIDFPEGQVLPAGAGQVFAKRSLGWGH
jgi:YD repeat-containing protein